jgi:hypothetical protein
VRFSKPPGRSRLLLALGLSVALLSATLLAFDRSASSAQQAPETTVAASDTSAATDTTGASSATDTTSPASDTTSPASDTTDTTGADATTSTAPAGNGDDGNINNLPLHDGTQKGGVFNPVPYGEIPANTPLVVIQRPGSGRILPLNQEIRIRATVENFQPGFFNDPKTQYGVDPQRLDAQGNLQGHNHACVQRIPADGQVASKCDSFVVLEQEGTTNVISGIGPPITVPGRYRVCVDDASGAHYVAVRAFAQQGGPVDCVRVLFMRLRARH